MVTSSLIACLVVLAGVAVAYPAAQEHAPVRRCGPLEICTDSEPVAPVRKRCGPLEVCVDSEPVAPVRKRCGPLEHCVDSESAVEQ
ncbi:hypothetical protein CFAM422_006629 [Trichoderma lentiforme]|uniref:Uncharacterized protein n=1 Tax=Trichoderma lentiforme TaxID=1567552 RepID=A0A9P5CCV4_9HYPO|nr:hypothetical protein CFAM422_006629 [Trichoderma lentiforme]